MALAHFEYLVDNYFLPRGIKELELAFGFLFADLASQLCPAVQETNDLPVNLINSASQILQCCHRHAPE
jgi:hypothetical protein